MKSSPIFAAGALLLSACLFWPGDENGPNNPFLGQWKSTEVSETSVRDTLFLSEFKTYLIERGYDFTYGYPQPPVPQATMDSFNAVFSCTAPICDSVVTVHESYWVVTRDSLFWLEAENGNVVGRVDYSYTWDGDSLYLTLYLSWVGTSKLSSDYRFSANRDTLILDEEFSPLRLVRNSDPLPD